MLPRHPAWVQTHLRLLALVALLRRGTALEGYHGATFGLVRQRRVGGQALPAHLHPKAG